MPDIEKMSSSEWLNYRADLIEKHLAGGGSLDPNPECKTCDLDNDYLCFECECEQLNKGVNHA